MRHLFLGSRRIRRTLVAVGALAGLWVASGAPVYFG